METVATEEVDVSMAEIVSENVDEEVDEVEEDTYNEVVEHRWELPVLSYHIIRVNYHYPILGVIVLVVLQSFYLTELP